MLRRYIGKFAVNSRKYSIRIEASNFINALSALTDFVAIISPMGKIISVKEV